MESLKDGTLVHMIERSDIAGHLQDDIAHNLIRAFDRFC
jgi:putative YphP/YqiW family bacilliredoxin